MTKEKAKEVQTLIIAPIHLKPEPSVKITMAREQPKEEVPKVELLKIMTRRDLGKSEPTTTSKIDAKTIKKIIGVEELSKSEAEKTITLKPFEMTPKKIPVIASRQQLGPEPGAGGGQCTGMPSLNLKLPSRQCFAMVLLTTAEWVLRC